MRCQQCHITPTRGTEDHFTPVGSGHLCTTCMDQNASIDSNRLTPTRLSRILVALNAERRILRDRLAAAEAFAALAADHLESCITTRDLEDALTEWGHYAGHPVKPEDDTLRSEL